VEVRAFPEDVRRIRVGTFRRRVGLLGVGEREKSRSVAVVESKLVDGVVSGEDVEGVGVVEVVVDADTEFLTDKSSHVSVAIDSNGKMEQCGLRGR